MFLPPLAPTFDAALRDAASQNAKFRLAAAERLADAPSGREDEAKAALRRLADDPLGPIRQAAVTGLGALGDADASALLHARFDDGHVEVRQAAVTAASRVDADVTWLLDLLDDPRPELRYQAIRGLVERLPTHAPRLVARLKDEDDRVASAAARALAELLADPEVEPMLPSPNARPDRPARAHDATRDGATRDGATRDGATRDGATRDGATRDDAARDDAARSEVLDALAEASEREGVAFAAAVALALLGDPRGEPALIRALDERATVLEAVEALGEIAGPAGVQALRALASRRMLPLLLRAAVGAALARRGEADGATELAKVLEAWRADGRDYAVHAAGVLRLEALVPTLVGLSQRLRGADPVTLAHTLRVFADREDARVALDRLSARFGEALTAD
ncbi:MAG: HEAT repeat domain-containing protein [Myxococcales bacterium]|nr:HEAT repeat domain-containing protein [Myxococcales bacterium]